ncbi:hypothetical protein RRG08_031370 [Elysia crispata]|uniref:Uncharacterized protein n=1 Tax=Elysia crispata TaxID=231223 RepID=A0AAE0YI59_9GAST|nr:hypothetical protein RRG08_031370 [Elysia crispata]
MSAKQSPTADGGSAGRPKNSFSHEPMEEEESLYSFVRQKSPRFGGSLEHTPRFGGTPPGHTIQVSDVTEHRWAARTRSKLEKKDLSKSSDPHSFKGFKFKPDHGRMKCGTSHTSWSSISACSQRFQLQEVLACISTPGGHDWVQSF